MIAHEPYLQIAVVDARASDYDCMVEQVEAQWTFFSSGEEALRHAPRGADAWLIASRLPDMPGLELCRSVRRWARPALFLVAEHYDRAEELAALELGGVHFLCKPLGPGWCEHLRHVRAGSRRGFAPLRLNT